MTALIAADIALALIAALLVYWVRWDIKIQVRRSRRLLDRAVWRAQENAADALVRVLH